VASDHDSGRFSHLTPQYGRGYLVGRLDFYKRRGGDAYGLAQIRGCIPLAQRCGVSDQDIADLLGSYGLTSADVEPNP
jgi:hypothetical protein